MTTTPKPDATAAILGMLSREVGTLDHALEALIARATRARADLAAGRRVSGSASIGTVLSGAAVDVERAAGRVDVLLTAMGPLRPGDEALAAAYTAEVAR